MQAATETTDAAGAAPPVIETPDFDKMKTAELVAFYDQHGGVGPTVDEFKKLKVAEKKALLKSAFPDPEALDSPDVTGLDLTDPIHRTVVEVASLKDEAAAIAYITSLNDDAQFNFFRVGGALAEMLAHGWMGDHEDFGSFVEAEFGFKLRKAQYLIAIYNALVTCGATWPDVKNVGWAKLALVASAGLLDAENYKEWIERIEDATFSSVHEMVKEAKGTKSGDGSTSGESTPTKKLKFTVHEDQEQNILAAIEKAKADGETEFDGPALEYLCLDYLSGPPAQSGETAEAETQGAPAPATAAAEGGPVDEALQAVMQRAVDEKGDATDALQLVVEALEVVFEEHFPDLDLEVYLDGKEDDLAGVE